MSKKQGTSPKMKNANGPRKVVVAKAGRHSARGASVKKGRRTENTGLLDEIMAHSFRRYAHQKPADRPSKPVDLPTERLRRAKIHLSKEIFLDMDRRGLLKDNSEHVKSLVRNFIWSMISDGPVTKPDALSGKKARVVVSTFLEIAPTVIVDENLSTMAGWRRYSSVAA